MGTQAEPIVSPIAWAVHYNSRHTVPVDSLFVQLEDRGYRRPTRMGPTNHFKNLFVIFSYFLGHKGA